MTLRASSLPRSLAFVLAPTLALCVSASSQAPAAQPNSPAPQLKSRTAPAQTTTQAQTPVQEPDRSAAYYHYGLAKMYEDQAVANGRQDLATQAIEQYKLAQDADCLLYTSDAADDL